MTGVSYFIEVKIEDQEGNMFPSPPEVTGGSYAEKLYSIAVSRFGLRPLSR